MMKLFLNIKIITIVVLLLSLFLACSNTEQKTAAVEKTITKHNKTQKVQVELPQQRSFTAEVLISGTAQPNQMVKLFAMESGYVTAILKDVGDKVRKGQVIAELINPKVEQIVADAEANIQTAQSNISLARAGLEATKANVRVKSSASARLRSVYQKTPALTSIMVVEEAEGATLIASANEQLGRASIQAAEQALVAANKQLEIAKIRQGQMTVTAPFSGVVTHRYVDKGALVQSGMESSNPQAIVEIQATNPIRLTLPVPETDAVGIKKGSEVAVTFPEISGKTIAAKVSRISGALDPQSKTMQVEIDLNNANGDILTGMYAKALIEIESRADILSLPVIAKVRHKNEDYVLVVEKNTVKRVAVKIGLRDTEYFEVLNSEITKETKVIVEGKSLVKPEQIVEAILKTEK